MVSNFFLVLGIPCFGHNLNFDVKDPMRTFSMHSTFHGKPFPIIITISEYIEKVAKASQ